MKILGLGETLREVIFPDIFPQKETIKIVTTHSS